MTTFDLRQAKLRPGEEYRDEHEVELTPFELGGERYVLQPDRPCATFKVTRASSGLVFELALETRLVGPCMRCLEDAALPLRVHAREYQATSAGEAEELSSPYIVDDLLDLSAWARDAVALALPDKILCTSDCAGLCSVCGGNLTGRQHDHGESEPDARWAKLAQLLGNAEER